MYRLFTCLKRVFFVFSFGIIALYGTVTATQAADFPGKGQAITVIVPFAAGGGGDLYVRAIQPWLEKELGARLQIENKPGAGSQVGLSLLARSKPDGYTIGWIALPSALNTYLNPDRQASYTRKSFQVLGLVQDAPFLVAVKGDSPYKSLADLVTAAKAKEGGMRAGSNGLMSLGHLTGLLFEKAAGVKFTWVHFDGSAPQNVALLGGHVDVIFGDLMTVQSNSKGGAIRVLAVTTKDPSPDLPGVPTAEQQGFKVYSDTYGFIIAPAGTPSDMTNAYSEALKNVIDNNEARSSMAKVLGNVVKYEPPEEANQIWDRLETELKPLLDQPRN